MLFVVITWLMLVILLVRLPNIWLNWDDSFRSCASLPFRFEELVFINYTNQENTLSEYTPRISDCKRLAYIYIFFWLVSIYIYILNLFIKFLLNVYDNGISYFFLSSIYLECLILFLSLDVQFAAKCYASLVLFFLYQ